MLKLFQKNNHLENIMSQLNMYTLQVALELETLKNINNKFDDMNKRLSDLEKRLSGEVKDNNNFIPLTVKNKEVIRLILERHGGLSASQLSKIIKLSRTRCNEYLIEMEKDGFLVSMSKGREKLYNLRH